MGANMQRQAVPLVKSDAPLGGHRHGGRWWPATAEPPSVAPSPGAWVETDRWHPPSSIRATEETDPTRPGVGHLPAFQVPAIQPVDLHQPASAGEGWRTESSPATSSADGPSTETWRAGVGAETPSSPSCLGTAYNFEDSILISERIVSDDVLHLDPHRGVSR